MALSFYFPSLVAPKVVTNTSIGITGGQCVFIYGTTYEPGFLENSEDQLFCHGYQLTNDDLKVLFVDDQNRFYTPYDIWYQVGFVTAIDGLFHRIGSEKCLPLQIRTGVLRPNFRIGDCWNTGQYEIRWFYQIYEGGPIEMRITPFIIDSCCGICDFEQTAPSFFDLPADLNIIDP